MIIDLTKIPAFWFGGIKPGREKRITNMFSRTGINATKTNTVLHSDSVIGCALSMKNALTTIVTKTEPCLLFEDDSETTANFRSTIIEVPDDADAVYLCLSKYGVAPDWKTRHRDAMAFEKNLTYQRLPDLKTIRLLNMVTLTSVLYISDEYKKHALSLIEKSISDRIHCDVPIALNLSKFKVYAFTHPLFYQECPLSKKSTNFNL